MIDIKDREKTAFTTQDGLFESNRMLFVFYNALDSFQRLMDFVLRSWPAVEQLFSILTYVVMT